MACSVKLLGKVTRAPGLLALALSICASGCATFHPVETTPQAILESVAPGDTVRITTFAGEELTLMVRSLTGYQVTGRRKDAPADVVKVWLDRMETIEVQRPDLRKAMLTTLVPVVIAAVIACNHQDCETRATLTATLEP